MPKHFQNDNGILQSNPQLLSAPIASRNTRSFRIIACGTVELYNHSTSKQYHGHTNWSRSSNSNLHQNAAKMVLFNSTRICLQLPNPSALCSSTARMIHHVHELRQLRRHWEGSALNLWFETLNWGFYWRQGARVASKPPGRVGSCNVTRSGPDPARPPSPSCQTVGTPGTPELIYGFPRTFRSDDSRCTRLSSGSGGFDATQWRGSLPDKNSWNPGCPSVWFKQKN